MSTDRIDSTGVSARPTPESNGHGEGAALRREVILLRARCAGLRHWCRALLDDPAAAGVLDEATAADLRDTPPEVTEAESQTVVESFARDESLPPNHPLTPDARDAGALRSVAASLTAEHERLRKAFFALYDRLHPGDDLTDEYFFALQSHGPMHALNDAVAEIEREFGSQP